MVIGQRPDAGHYFTYGMYLRGGIAQETLTTLTHRPQPGFKPSG